jgi:hypothetical protein
MSFASLIQPQPVADSWVASLRNRLAKYGVNMKAITRPAGDSLTFSVAYTFNGKEIHHGQITALSIEGDEPVVHKAEGFPQHVLDQLLKLSPAASQQADPTRTQAHAKADPDQEDGRTSVGQEVRTLQAAALIASLDLLSVSEYENETRAYIGASGVGNPCMAYQALSLRGFPSVNPEPQLMRIFDEGHRVEAMAIDTLRRAGHAVSDRDQETGRQWRFTSHGGHHSASLDGVITLRGSSEEMTLEIKSMNRKSFDSFKSKGLAISHPSYHAQMMDGMGLANREAGRVRFRHGLMLAYCKDSSRWHAEVLEYSPAVFDSLMEKVSSVVEFRANKRISRYRESFDCKGCFKRSACWDGDTPENASCRHCAHAEPSLNGGWTCVLTAQPAIQTCKEFHLWRPAP